MGAAVSFVKKVVGVVANVVEKAAPIIEKVNSVVNSVESKKGTKLTNDIPKMLGYQYRVISDVFGSISKITEDPNWIDSSSSISVPQLAILFSLSSGISNCFSMIESFTVIRNNQVSDLKSLLLWHGYLLELFNTLQILLSSPNTPKVLVQITPNLRAPINVPTGSCNTQTILSSFISGNLPSNYDGWFISESVNDYLLVMPDCAGLVRVFDLNSSHVIKKKMIESKVQSNMSGSIRLTIMSNNFTWSPVSLSKVVNGTVTTTQPNWGNMVPYLSEVNGLVTMSFNFQEGDCSFQSVSFDKNKNYQTCLNSLNKDFMLWIDWLVE